jgi:hypothetical protein
MSELPLDVREFLKWSEDKKPKCLEDKTY